MTSIKISSLLLLALAAFGFFTTGAVSRSFNKRSDLENVKPVSESGYTVPLQAGKNSLPAPASDKILQALTICRGVLMYECPNYSDPTEEPAYVGQKTDLYDVAPLIPDLPSEDTLRELVNLFVTYDYQEVQNTSLVLTGNIFTSHGETTVVLVGHESFVVHVHEVIPSPLSDGYHGNWVHSTTTDNAWEVYRVETIGGVVPASCQGQNATFNLSYGAEYWFYHK